jgi:hypothetical protein
MEIDKSVALHQGLCNIEDECEFKHMMMRLNGVNDKLSLRNNTESP